MIRARGWLIASIACAAFGCADAPATRSSGDGRGMADAGVPVLQLRVADRVTGFAIAGDTISLDGAVGAALAGDTVYVLHRHAGLVIRHGFGDGVTAVLRRTGAGPGDVDPQGEAIAVSRRTMFAVAAGAGGTLRVWTGGGDVLYTRRLEVGAPQPSAPSLIRLALDADSAGRVYVGIEERVGDVVEARLYRYGPAEPDNATLPYTLPTAQLLPVRGIPGGYVLITDHIFRNGTGALSWAVAPDGLVYVANADRYRVDTLRIDGGRGSFIAMAVDPPPELTRAEVEQVLSRATAGGRSAHPDDVMPVLPATITALHHSGTHLWVGRGRTRADAGEWVYDLFDDDGAMVARVASPYRVADVSGRTAIAWTTGPSGELMMLRLAFEEGSAGLGSGAAP